MRAVDQRTGVLPDPCRLEFQSGDMRQPSRTLAILTPANSRVT